MSTRRKVVSIFPYRGMDCEVVEYGSHVNGYMIGKINVCSDDEANRVAYAHGGFTYYDRLDDGRTKLGFDTMHHYDGPQTRNEGYVTGAIKAAVENLISAGVVEDTQ